MPLCVRRFLPTVETDATPVIPNAVRNLITPTIIRFLFFISKRLFYLRKKPLMEANMDNHK